MTEIPAQNTVVPLNGPVLIPLSVETSAGDGGQVIHADAETLSSSSAKQLAHPEDERPLAPAAQDSVPWVSALSSTRNSHQIEAVPPLDAPAPHLTEQPGADRAMPIGRAPGTEQEPAPRAQAPREETVTRFEQPPIAAQVVPSNIPARMASSKLDEAADWSFRTRPPQMPSNFDAIGPPHGSSSWSSAENYAQPRIGTTAEKASGSASHPGSSSISVVAAAQDPIGPHSLVAATVGFVNGALSGSDPARALVRQPGSVEERLTTMDAAPLPETTKWTMGGTHQAEAGFQDVSLGWVTVRAQEAAGAIHATIIPAAQEAAEVLSGHLESLNAHMASQSPHLGPISLAAPDASTGQTSSDGQGQASNRQHQEQRSHPQEGPAGAHLTAGPFVTAATNRETMGSVPWPTETGSQVSVLV